MSKIDQIQPVKPQTLGQPSKTQSPKGPSFQEILDKATVAASEVSKTQPTILEPTSNPQTVNSVETNGLSPAQSQGLGHVQRIIELLGEMDACIQSKSLKQAQPVVKALEEEAGRLETVLGKLEPDLNDAAYGIMEEAWGRALAETIKFNRGDFIPQTADET